MDFGTFHYVNYYFFSGLYNFYYDSSEPCSSLNMMNLSEMLWYFSSFYVENMAWSLLSSYVLPTRSIYVDISSKYVILTVGNFFFRLNNSLLNFDLLYRRFVRSNVSHHIIPVSLDIL